VEVRILSLARTTWSKRLRARSGFVSSRGSALIEASLLLPMVLTLMLNTMNFGVYIYDWITVIDAARAATEYQVYNGSVAGSTGSPPSIANVQAVAKADAASLYAVSTALTASPCANANGTLSPASCTGQADPEPTKYTAYTVTVSYSFSPLLVSALSLIPATTISQSIVMRSMQ
jgi:Flp pilus assembly protein TadG